MGTIQYRPLDPFKTEIRLIELFPRATNSSTQRERAPRCNLIHVSLDDKPDYMALSYTWGDPQDTEIITVGESSVSVTRNLYSGLEHLQYDKTVRVIWIDALCINQTDKEEKSWQVQLMREIYQRATFVSIWIGPADTTSDKVMDFLNLLGTEAMGFGLDGGPDLIRNVSSQWMKLASHPPSFRDRSRQRVTVAKEGNATSNIGFQMGDLNKLYYSISGFHEQDRLFPVEGMASLFKRGWWSRIWVLQELTLAQKAGFVCGTKRLSRRCCTAALNAFKALGYVLNEMHILKGVKQTEYQRAVATAGFDWRPTVLLSMWDTHRYSPYPLLALLRATCIAGISSGKEFVLEATDPRDKIYGLLGLAADRDKLKEFGVLPDYTRSCQDLYISVAVAILRQGHLSALSHGHFSKSRIGLPSWVPDWSKPLGDTLQGTSTDHMTPEPGYNASGLLLQREPTFSGIGAAISVSLSGVAYDEVHDIGATWDDCGSLGGTAQQSFVKAKRLLEELVRLSFLRDKLFKDLKERICSVARTVTAEIGFSDNGRWARIGNQRYHTAVSIMMMIRINSPCERKLLISGFLELIKSDGIHPEIDMRAGKYCGEIVAKAYRRKSFVTAKGHLGLGPDCIRPGDAIAVLIGNQVPFVLRKGVDGKYQIVGEAYVDGIMDGEAVAGMESVGTIELT